MTLSKNDPPAHDEIEISVFGRGLGEAVLIHLGDDRWVAIDSFSIERRSIAEIYLREIGSDPASCVDLIVASHWHDDHIKGIAHLFETSLDAEFVVPLAMRDDEFIKFASSFATQRIKSFSTGVEEFGRVLGIAARRHRPNTQSPLRFAEKGYLALRVPPGTLPHGVSITLEALSPSHFDVRQFLGRLAARAPTAAVLQRAPNPRPNDVSAAFWLQIGADAVLFGADLENGNDVNGGWKAVIASEVQPPGRASLVKIPHHGGASGFSEDMWAKLLQQNPIGTLTPWTRGGKRLPTGSDIDRLKAVTNQAYSTGPSATAKPGPQPPIVIKELANANANFRRVITKVGCVRHRGTISNGLINWRTELLGEACRLQEMVR